MLGFGGGAVTLKEDLLAVAALLEPEGAWTQKVDARDKGGIPVMARFETACSHCLDGALIVVGEGGFTKRYDAMALVLRKEIGGDYLVHWNDITGRTQAEVVALVRRAAEAQP